jgi:hypothetical protein
MYILDDVEENKFRLVEASILSSNVFAFLNRISELPSPWSPQYFENGKELLKWLSNKGFGDQERIAAVIPSDIDIPLEKLLAQALDHNIMVLVILGKAYRAKVDRNIRYYITGGRYGMDTR